MNTRNPLTERLVKLLLNTPFGVNFEAEEGTTQRYFGKTMRLYMSASGVLVITGDNGKMQLCDIVDTCWNGYVKVVSNNVNYHLFSNKLGEYLRHN